MPRSAGGEQFRVPFTLDQYGLEPAHMEPAGPRSCDSSSDRTDGRGLGNVGRERLFVIAAPRRLARSGLRCVDRCRPNRAQTRRSETESSRRSAQCKRAGAWGSVVSARTASIRICLSSALPRGPRSAQERGRHATANENNAFRQAFLYVCGSRGLGCVHERGFSKHENPVLWRCFMRLFRVTRATGTLLAIVKATDPLSALESYARMRGHRSFAKFASACGLGLADAREGFSTQEVRTPLAKTC